MKVYLAVPIIANRQLKRARALAQVIGDLGHELVSSWVINEDPGFYISARSVFERDLQGVKNCDVLVAEISQGSHGVGMEIMAGYLHGKRIIALHEEGARVSHMLQGVPNAVLIGYDSFEDMTDKLRTALREVSTRHRS